MAISTTSILLKRQRRHSVSASGNARGKSDAIYPRALKARLKECFARRRLHRDVVIADTRSAVYRI
jgi:hypothetical protein